MRRSRRFSSEERHESPFPRRPGILTVLLGWIERFLDRCSFQVLFFRELVLTVLRQRMITAMVTCEQSGEIGEIRVLSGMNWVCSLELKHPLVGYPKQEAML